MMVEQCSTEKQKEESIINKDTLYEVLSRVDGPTLGMVSCASSVLNSITKDENIWERICIDQWPSTESPEIRSLIKSIGGFWKFYTECFPLILSKQPFVFDDDVYSSTLIKDAEDWFGHDEEDVLEELSGTSPDDFVSIIDVLFKGKSVGSRVVYGIPGSDDFHGWFLNSPFQINSLGEDDGGMSIKEGFPDIEKEKKDGHFWELLQDEIRVSWILVNKKTNEMANLSSWRPVGGQRHWPSDKHFMIQFGSILPSHQLLARKVVQCNVLLKCKRVLSDPNSGEVEKSSLLITELSIQLEDMAGSYLKGCHSLLVLREALSCPKSMNHEKVMSSYGDYVRARSEFNEEKLTSEGRVDTICIICGILSFVSFCYFWF